MPWDKMTLSDADSLDLDPKSPIVDGDRIRQVHNELQTMPEINLDPDPLSSGPKVMNNRVASARNQLTRVHSVELQLLEDRGWFQRELTRERGKYKMKFTDLVAHNPEVRSGRATADREAAANVILHESVSRIQELELSIETIEHLLEAVRSKQRDLRNLQTQLKDQLKICEHELNLGGRWGQKTHGMYPEVSNDASAIDDLVEAIDNQVPTQPDPEEEPESSATIAELYQAELGSTEDTAEDEPEPSAEEVLPSKTSSVETDSFLDVLEVEDTSDQDQVSAAEVDLDDLLDGLDD